MNIIVNRIWPAPDNAEHRATVTGVVKIDGQQVCFCLEPIALMIPPGSYPVKMAMSHRFNRMTPHIDVPMRTNIEIHGGNLATDSEGCILVAEHRMSDYQIYEAAPATDYIESALRIAEASGEVNTVIVVQEYR